MSIAEASPVSATAGDNTAADTRQTAFLDLLGELTAFEHALRTWKLEAIADGELRTRSALERLRALGGPPPERLRELMRLLQRCQRLSRAGASIAGSVARIGSLTYQPPPADTLRGGTSAVVRTTTGDRMDPGSTPQKAGENVTD